MAKVDPIPPELREIEKEVDLWYLNNPLIKLDFAQAAWYFLAFCEELIIREVVEGTDTSLQYVALVADNLVVHMKYPMRWLYDSCQPNGIPSQKYDADLYQAAWDLSKLSQQYEGFELAFTQASIGNVKLELEDNTVIATQELRRNTCYDAYDRLAKYSQPPQEIDPSLVIETIAQSLKIQEDQFSYQLNPKIVKICMEVLEPDLSRRFQLPQDWQFTRYMLKDFHTIALVLNAMAFIHFQARVMAAYQGCEGLGYSNSLIVMSRDELLRRLIRYSGLSESVVSAIIEDLTYGARKIRNPDPAIQPLVLLNENLYAISPNLILSSASERNFVVLLNKIPEERRHYSGLVEQKEKLLRNEIIQGSEPFSIRPFWGRVPTWDTFPDVDLAMISETEKQCLVLELKSFVDPAEVREVVEKSEEIEKGIKQAKLLRSQTNSDPEPLYRALNIDSSYSIEFAVASANSIGLVHIQDETIPVIRASHLISKLQQVKSLKDVIEWLVTREYLPEEGKHYETIDSIATVGDWNVKWYGLKPLIEDEYI